jgi:hypothetical protein
MSETLKAYRYLTNCIGANGRDICDMKDRAVEVSYRTARSYCEGLIDWACSVGYSRRRSQGLALRDDWHVGYYRSVFRGRRCYYVKWSAIEYIWVKKAA